jgi:hypothetical protein
MPFGGAVRSTFIGASCTLAPLFGAYEDNLAIDVLCRIGFGCAGPVILCVDVPLSLIGDTLSLPIVFARQRGAAWASWWGEPSTGAITQLAPAQTSYEHLISPAATGALPPNPSPGARLGPPVVSTEQD